MTHKKIELNYDPETDLLEIFIGNPAPSYFNEIDDDLLKKIIADRAEFEKMVAQNAQ